MKLDEVRLLRNFRVGERRIDKHLINWDQADYELFRILDDIRDRLKAPIRIIREWHEERIWPAVDWITTADTGHVVQVVGSYPVGFGVYAGTTGPSFHVDTRTFRENAPAARWMAIRPRHRPDFDRYEPLVTTATEPTDHDLGWVYYTWEHPRSYHLLRDLIILADQNYIRHHS